MLRQHFQVYLMRERYLVCNKSSNVKQMVKSDIKQLLTLKMKFLPYYDKYERIEKNSYKKLKKYHQRRRKKSKGFKEIFFYLYDSIK